MINRLLRWLFRAKPTHIEEASQAVVDAANYIRAVDMNQERVDATIEGARRTVAESDEQIAQNHVNELFMEAFRRPGK